MSRLVPFDDDEYREMVRGKSVKPRFELIDPTAELGLAMLLTSGAWKYGDGDWKGLGGVERDPVYGALMRHYNAIRRGDLIDDEFALPHSVHLLANAMFLASWDLGEREMEQWIEEWSAKDEALREGSG